MGPDPGLWPSSTPTGHLPASLRLLAPRPTAILIRRGSRRGVRPFGQGAKNHRKHRSISGHSAGLGKSFEVQRQLSCCENHKSIQISRLRLSTMSRYFGVRLNL
jgi:hypothetical protein